MSLKCLNQNLYVFLATTHCIYFNGQWSGLASTSGVAEKYFNFRLTTILPISLRISSRKIVYLVPYNCTYNNY